MGWAQSRKEHAAEPRITHIRVPEGHAQNKTGVLADCGLKSSTFPPIISGILRLEDVPRKVLGFLPSW